VDQAIAATSRTAAATSAMTIAISRLTALEIDPCGDGLEANGAKLAVPQR
jgi:hypothetical protein